MPGYTEKEARQIYQEWEAQFDAPVVPRVMVGFSSVDPDRKQTGGGGGGVTETRVNEIVTTHAAANTATKAEFNEMLANVGLIA